MQQTLWNPINVTASEFASLKEEKKLQLQYDFFNSTEIIKNMIDLQASNNFFLC